MMPSTSHQWVQGRVNDSSENGKAYWLWPVFDHATSGQNASARQQNIVKEKPDEHLVSQAGNGDWERRG